MNVDGGIVLKIGFDVSLDDGKIRRVLRQVVFVLVVADAVYVGLKPAEWFCRLGLRVILGRCVREVVGMVL